MEKERECVCRKKTSHSLTTLLRHDPDHISVFPVTLNLRWMMSPPSAVTSTGSTYAELFVAKASRAVWSNEALLLLFFIFFMYN